MDGSLHELLLFKRLLPVVLLGVFWALESARPFFQPSRQRYRHAWINLVLALSNTGLLALVFGSLPVAVANASQQANLGLLHLFPLSGAWHVLAGLVLLDGWMYLWHRANHAVPWLWRWHRTHHSDPHMDVTTATRFHLGEQVLAAVLRLALIPLVGFEVWDLVLYDCLVYTATQFHHANISLGVWDRWLRWLIVTPLLHKVHHSQYRPETDSNYATVFSFWDRLAGTFRVCADPSKLVLGLREFRSADWQTLAGLWRTPFAEEGVLESSSRGGSQNANPL